VNIQEIFDKEYWNAIEGNFTSKKYTNSIIDAMLFISDTIREKTELEDDGVKLINNSFSKINPKIKISNLETQTDQDKQEGIANILRGLYQFIRNPRHHEKIEDIENDAISILLFINYIYKTLVKSKPNYEIDDFIKLVTDEGFVNEDEYVELIISRIPKRKIINTIFELFNYKENCDFYIYNKVSTKLFVCLKAVESQAFLNKVESELLVVNDDTNRKYILASFPPEKWSQIDKLARIRTENRILKSIEIGKDENSNKGWLATWCTSYFKYFITKEKILQLIHSKIESNEESQIRYCTKYILNNIWEMLDPDELEKLDTLNNDPWAFALEYWFIFSMAEKIRSLNENIYNYVKVSKYIIPKKVNNYFKSALLEYEDKIKNKSDDDDFAIDIPF